LSIDAADIENEIAVRTPDGRRISTIVPASTQ
jgi:hypothetical protein